MCEIRSFQSEWVSPHSSFSSRAERSVSGWLIQTQNFSLSMKLPARSLLLSTSSQDGCSGSACASAS